MSVNGGVLKCPRCGNEINYANKSCSECGHLFSEDIYKKMFFYFDVKNDFNNLISVENNVSDRLLKISRKIENFEALLLTDINNQNVKYDGAVNPAPVEDDGRRSADNAFFSDKPEAAVDEKNVSDMPDEITSAAGRLYSSDREADRPAEPVMDASVSTRQSAVKSAFAPGSGMSGVKKIIENKRALNTGAAPGLNAGNVMDGAHNSTRPGLRRNLDDSPEDNFEIMLGQKWMLIIGIITIVFGVGYFLKYSFERELIGPAGQLTLAYILGAVFLRLGYYFHQKSGFVSFGLLMTGGAIAVFYFASFAAFQLYRPPVIGQEASFVIMVLITVLACALSIKFDAKWLAVLGIIGGFLTPVMLSRGSDNFYGLMGYITLLNCGVLYVAFKKNWNLLNTLAFFGTYILFSGWYLNYYGTKNFLPAILFLNLFYLIYSVAPFAYQFIKKQEKPSSVAAFVVMTLNSFFAFGFSYDMIYDYFRAAHYVSIITVFYAAVFLAMASHLFKQGRRFSEAFVAMLALASLFLIIMIPILFSKQWITFFWAAQAFTLFFMAVRLSRAAIFAGAYALFAIALLKLLFVDYSMHGAFNFNFDIFRIYPDFSYLLAGRYVAWAGSLTLLFSAANIAYRKGISNIVYGVKDSAVLYTVLGICLFIILNFETASFLYDYLREARFAFISGLWAVYAAALMIIGFKFNSYAVRKTSIALFTITLIKVFVYDMDDMSTPWRILSFMILGGILISVSFFYHKFKDGLITVLKKNEGN